MAVTVGEGRGSRVTSGVDAATRLADQCSDMDSMNSVEYAQTTDRLTGRCDTRECRRYVTLNRVEFRCCCCRNEARDRDPAGQVRVQLHLLAAERPNNLAGIKGELAAMTSTRMLAMKKWTGE
jgi:hypothetical protein